MSVSESNEVFDWIVDVPLLTSRFMVWDFFKVSLFAVVGMYLSVAACGLLMEGELIVLPIAVFGLTFGILLALFVLTSLLLGNHQKARFIVDSDGVEYQAQRRERALSRFAFIAGLLARNPSVAGAGALAASREQLRVPWSDVRRVVVHERAHVIELRNSWRAVQRLYCPADQFPRIVSAAKAYHAAAIANSKQDG